MQKRILGKDLEVSAVGLGCMGFTHAYGTAMDETEAAKAIAEAVDMGYTFFDTAECYLGNRADGTLARNEDLVGEALKPYRNYVKTATKCGVQHSPEGLVMDSRPETIRKAIEESLTRLQTDHVDLYYQHRIDPKIAPEEVAGVMADLIKEGKILHWGISETGEEYFSRAHAVCPITCVQNRLSMMARWHESLFPVLEELNVGFVAFSPLANGFLSDAFKKGETFEDGDFRNLIPQYREENYDANRNLLNLVRWLAADKNATPAQISLAWMINKKSYIVPIHGSRKVDRIRENFESGNIILTADEVAQIDQQFDMIQTSGCSVVRRSKQKTEVLIMKHKASSKKVLAVLLSTLMIFALIACSSQNGGKEPDPHRKAAVTKTPLSNQQIVAMRNCPRYQIVMD